MKAAWLAVPLAAALSGAAAAAPTTAAVKRCRAAFDFPSSVEAINRRIDSEIAAHAAGVDFNALKDSMIAYAECEAVSNRRLDDCRWLDAVTNAGQATVQCLENYRLINLWLTLDAGQAPPNSFCATGAARGVPPERVCEALRAAWSNHVNPCDAVASLAKPEFVRECRKGAALVLAPRFVVPKGMADGEAFSQWVGYQLWNKVPTKCNASVPLGQDSRLDRSLRWGACIGAFEAPQCDRILDRVKAYYCGG